MVWLGLGIILGLHGMSVQNTSVIWQMFSRKLKNDKNFARYEKKENVSV